ncbi:MAG: NAD(P)/FAD-dependent oxidoreductase [Deltaproteobacteria bacterium]|nr:NAD(P)/FAD-dependent oxidoreductase [Deltaproteobacteria bacterium]
MKHVVIVGGGFAGLNAARILGGQKGVSVTLIDRRNHHLFQPLLYQVATAGLSPAEIAAPIRTLLSRFSNISVLQAEVRNVDSRANTVHTDHEEISYDYLLLACGASHSYFGNEHWEAHAPGLKTIEQATEIRRRVLTAFERAERARDRAELKRNLTFVIVRAGPTGVELAGAIAEMSRFTLSQEFRSIDPGLTRVILIEAGPRILPMFSDAQSAIAMRDLEKIGVQVWTSSMVTSIDEEGVEIGSERVEAATVVWAAGVKAPELNKALEGEKDRQGRVVVQEDLSLESSPNIFVVGDQAHFAHNREAPLPGVAPVALQQGKWAAKNILRDLKEQVRLPFVYTDKGQMATIGRSRAIMSFAGMEFRGFFAWLSWLLVHIYYLAGFRNRVFVVMQWAWSYMTFRRSARLIVDKEWRSFPPNPVKSTKVL